MVVSACGVFVRRRCRRERGYRGRSGELAGDDGFGSCDGSLLVEGLVGVAVRFPGVLYRRDAAGANQRSDRVVAGGLRAERGAYVYASLAICQRLEHQPGSGLWLGGPGRGRGRGGDSRRTDGCVGLRWRTGGPCGGKLDGIDGGRGLSYLSQCGERLGRGGGDRDQPLDDV